MRHTDKSRFDLMLCKRLAVITAAIFLVCVTAGKASAEFINFDFESAHIDLSHLINYSLPASEALPGWDINFNPPYVAYDTGSLGSTLISLQDGHNSGFPLNPIEGHYSVFLQTGVPFYGQPEINAAMWQTGDVPANARSLLFFSDYLLFGELVVSLDGTVIPMSVYAVSPAVNPPNQVQTFIGDISAFAGQSNVELRFQLARKPPPNPIADPMASASLDYITFSSIIVPEPSTAALLALAAIACGGFFAFRRRQHRAKPCMASMAPAPDG